MNAGFSWLPNTPVNNVTSPNYSNGTCSDIYFSIISSEDFKMVNNGSPYNNDGLIVPSSMTNSATNIDITINFNQSVNNLRIRFVDLDENGNPYPDPEETITLINPPPAGVSSLGGVINPIFLSGDELSPFDNNPSINNNDASGWANWVGSLSQISFRYNRPGQLYGLIIDSIYFDCFSPSQLELPNVFTPNNDGNNDLFEPVLYNQIFSPHFMIFNRWGNVIFESFDSKPTWNGEINGKQCHEGVYFWKLDFDDNDMNTDSKHGFFHLIK
jgi:gliding motility-associated-like protein